MGKYTTVLFDIDNTLLNFDEDERKALSLTLRHYKIEPTDERLKIYAEANLALWKKFEKGEIEKDDIFKLRFKHFFEKAQIHKDIDPVKLNSSYADFLTLGGTLKSGAAEILTKLKKGGISIYAVTNGTKRSQENRLGNSGLDKLFDGIFISECIGFQKPKKEYFDAVLKEICEKDKKKIIVVGDSLTSDIRGALNAGLDCIWLNESGAQNSFDFSPTYTIESLLETEEIILKK